jgi:hypothetical protein
MKHLVLACLLAGCQTTFTGDPHISPADCQAKCQQTNLVMAGIVYMGEYSSACICEVPRPPGAPVSSIAVGATGGAAAGVVMQMRRAQSQSSRRY